MRIGRHTRDLSKSGLLHGENVRIIRKAVASWIGDGQSRTARNFGDIKEAIGKLCMKTETVAKAAERNATASVLPLIIPGVRRAYFFLA